ncbi:MAG: hypothetical protein HQM09_18525 [Candidatus Riflebacteria bacterium]|nr:hypothetical protein [Candidatus Riflebacteria bacterium]
MSNSKWYIIFAVTILCVFTLGILHRHNRIHGAGRQIAYEPRFDDTGLPDHAPDILDNTPVNRPQAPSGRQLAPPPDFVFESPTPEENSRAFKALGEKSKAIRIAEEEILSSTATGTGDSSQ